MRQQTSPVAVLLPGLDGTAELFGPFIANAPIGIRLERVRLPDRGAQSYRGLVEHVAQALPTGPVHLIAESFSGPLAILLATELRDVASVVLCASFAIAPMPRVLAGLPDWLLSRPPPTALVSAFMSGGDRSTAEALSRAVSQVSARTLAERIREVLRVDVTPELSELTIPILYVRAMKDRLVRAKAARQVQEANPSCRIVGVNAPHLVLQTRPTEAWHVIKPFIDEVGLPE